MGISAGQDWTEEIASAICECALVIGFISENALESDIVDKELKYSIKQKKSTMFVFLEDVELPKASGLDFIRGLSQPIKKFELKKDHYREKSCDNIGKLIE